MKLGPGSFVLNQDSGRPCGGTVIPAPEGTREVEGSVWVRWTDTKVGENGVCLEFLQDVTLTGKVNWVE